jgi:hypothetical protein
MRDFCLERYAIVQSMVRYDKAVSTIYQLLCPDKIAYGIFLYSQYDRVPFINQNIGFLK